MPRANGQSDCADLDYYLQNVAGLGPLIDQAAKQAEHERKLPAELLDALHNARLFRLLLPRTFAGAEINPFVFCQIIEAVAKLDASTAWCLCQANGCAMAAAYLPHESAAAIWGDNPHAVLAWGPGAKTSAVIEGDGYRVKGKWSFASGCRHASWLGAHCTVFEADGKPLRRADGSRVQRTLLVPAGQASLIDNWNVMGLRATGSFGFRIDNLFVHRDYSLSRDDPHERRCHNGLYQFPAMSLYASGFSATALGVARNMLDAFKTLAGDKIPRLGKQVLRDNAVVQADVALAEARLSAARVFLLSELDAIWQEVTASGQLSISQRMRIRLAATHAIHEAKQVADLVYDAAGASAIFADSAFERRFRDMHTITQQVQGRKSHYQTVGAFMLGQPPDLAVI